MKTTVEYYQWVETSQSETQNNAGGSSTTTTTYTYNLEWDGTKHSSSSFKHPEGHHNYFINLDSKTENNDNVTLDAFFVPGSLFG